MRGKCTWWLNLTDQDLLLYKENLSLPMIEEKVQETLSRGGRVILVCDNKLSVRDFNGYIPEGEDEFFAHINDAKSISERREYSKKELLSLLAKWDITNYRFYYPYPFADFTYEIYSDVKLPQLGELHQEEYPFPTKRMELFREQNLYDRLIEEDLFDRFCNSYLLVMGQELPKEDYIKYSSERKEGLNICTLLEDNHRVVKRAVDDCSVKQIDYIEKIYEKLDSLFAKSKLLPNRCYRIDKRAIGLDFVQGKPLNVILDQFLAKGDSQSFEQYIEEYRNQIANIYGHGDTNDLDIDLIFQNILVDGDCWNVIDYEWTFEKAYPVQFLLYRAIYYYYYQSALCREKYPQIESLYEMCEIPLDAIAEYKKLELEFQQSVMASDAPSQNIDNQGKILLSEMLRYEEYLALAKERMEVIDSLNAQCLDRMERIEYWQNLAEERLGIIKEYEEKLHNIPKFIMIKIIEKCKKAFHIK